ncbi:MAG: sulfatase [bacterium]|jgi:arylsulfatase A-like enzyme|nr:sulfatase [bacterium]
MFHSITRRQCLKTLALGAALGPRFSSHAEEAKPNIVFILVDDLGWMDTGCYGSQYFETPHIDRLAAQGMRFTDAYAACAVCSPTRASILTGRYPARIGITDWIRAGFQGGAGSTAAEYPTAYVGTPKEAVLCPPNPFWLKHEERTIAELLKEQGYTTCHIGKWHLGSEQWYPETQGFDYNIGGCDYGQPPSYFDPYKNNRLANIPTLPPRKEGEYLTDRLGDEAVAFIDAHADKPFFLYMANYAVHTPLQGKPDLVEKYTKKEKTQQSHPIYAAMVQSVDECVGKIMRVLEEKGIADNTLILFTGDNGGLSDGNPAPTNNQPLREGKGYPYEGGIREPLIVRWPRRIKAGTLCDTPVTSVDFLPTLCEAAGAALPADRAIDGLSLMPLLRKEGEWTREAIFWHFPHYRYCTDPYSIIRQGQWKLIKRYGQGTMELYNLKEDLSETTDLATEKPDIVNTLNERLQAWLQETGAKVPIPNPEYDPLAK